MQTDDLQGDEVNIFVNLLKVYFRDRESIRAFLNNVYIVYLPVLKSAVALVAHRSN